MRAFDLSPLLRSGIGFDHFNRLLDIANRGEDTPNYPPYNIEKHGEDRYRITMAVAGFSQAEMTITLHENSLIVAGAPQEAQEAEEADIHYLHRGIARRSFERRFQLADGVKVKAAHLLDGLLHIELERVLPDAKKPRQIPIETGSEGRKGTRDAQVVTTNPKAA